MRDAVATRSKWLETEAVIITLPLPPSYLYPRNGCINYCVVGHKNGAEKWLSANAIRLFESRQFLALPPSPKGPHAKKRIIAEWGNTCVHDGQADCHAFFHSRLLALEVQILTRPPFPPLPSRASPLSHPEFTL